MTDPRRRADVARHVRLGMADVERDTAQPADAEAVLAEGAAVLARLGAGPPGGRPARAAASSA